METYMLVVYDVAGMLVYYGNNSMECFYEYFSIIKKEHLDCIFGDGSLWDAMVEECDVKEAILIDIENMGEWHCWDKQDDENPFYQVNNMSYQQLKEHVVQSKKHTKQLSSNKEEFIEIIL